jgi:hypothetical protein
LIETLEWLVQSCERTAEAPDLLPDDSLAEPESAGAAPRRRRVAVAPFLAGLPRGGHRPAAGCFRALLPRARPGAAW